MVALLFRRFFIPNNGILEHNYSGQDDFIAFRYAPVWQKLPSNFTLNAELHL